MLDNDMPEPEDTLRESPIDFDSAVAYALHPEMRRLIILYIVGTLLLPIGLEMFLRPGVYAFGFGAIFVPRVIGLLITLVGATFFISGLIGAVFKLVTDATIIAQRYQRD